MSHLIDGGLNGGTHPILYSLKLRRFLSMSKQGWKWLFFVYIVMVLNFIVIKFNGNIYAVMNTIEMNMSRRAMDGEGINLVPFRTIGTYITNLSFGVALSNIVGNIIPFIPLGFLLPMAFPSQRKIMRTMVTCFLIIFSIEVIQLVSFLGSFDVDDIILNLFSCLVGYLLFIAYKGFLIKNRERTK